MAVNLAMKYSNKVDERFTTAAFTEKATNQDYEWDGVSSIKVYSIPTVAMNSYSRTGLARYGTAADLGDTLATYALTRDRAFTFVIDAGDKMDSMNVRDAGKALSRQINEVIIPEVDTYRLATLVTAAAANSGRPAATTITSSNAYTSFLQANAYLDENKVPQGGRVVFCTPSYYNFLKLDPTFLMASDTSVEKKFTGQVGEIDGVPIVKAPSTYFATKTPFILTHKSAMVAPKKLQDYKIHTNPPGINGQLVEGRIYYDAFVLDAKKKGVYAWLEV